MTETLGDSSHRSNQNPQTRRHLASIKKRMIAIGCKEVQNLEERDFADLILKENVSRLPLIIWLLNKTNCGVTNILTESNEALGEKNIEILSDVAVCCGLCKSSNKVNVITGKSDIRTQLYFWTRLVEYCKLNDSNMKDCCDLIDEIISTSNLNTIQCDSVKVVDTEQISQNITRCRTEYQKSFDVILAYSGKELLSIDEIYSAHNLEILKNNFAKSLKSLSSFFEFYNSILESSINRFSVRPENLKLADSFLVKRVVENGMFIQSIFESMRNSRRFLLDMKNEGSIEDKCIDLDLLININDLFYNRLH